MQAPMVCFSCNEDFSDKVEIWRQGKKDLTNANLTDAQLLLKLFPHPYEKEKHTLCDFCVAALLTDINSINKLAYFNPPVRISAPIRRN
jgi:hypothetical protein